MRVRGKEERLGRGVDGKCNFTNCCGVTAGESASNWPSTEHQDKHQHPFGEDLHTAPSQWAGESRSTGPIEIQGPRRQDMTALGQVRRWTRRCVGSSSG